MGILSRLFGQKEPPSRPPTTSVAPIVDDPTKRGIQRDFRRSGDPPHIIRVNQDRPKGLPKRLFKYIPVAGVTKPPGVNAVPRFIGGSMRVLTLERDPTDKFDTNAVKVIGEWNEDGERCRSQLGWLPAEAAEELASKWPDAPIGATLEAMFRQRPGRGPGLRIDVWGPRAKRRPS